MCYILILTNMVSFLLVGSYCFSYLKVPYKQKVIKNKVKTTDNQHLLSFFFHIFLLISTIILCHVYPFDICFRIFFLLTVELEPFFQANNIELNNYVNILLVFHYIDIMDLFNLFLMYRYL